ncbi:MAG: cation:proton antiporter [Actinobacteria bacterium]|nr:cation:proton antiporter [Actinomycetota bacterium]
MDGAPILLELGGVLLGLAVLARLAGKFGISPIPFYLVIGLAVGKGGIVPLVTADEFIRAGAEIGVVLLLFMLGLEYSAEELGRNLRSGAPAGMVDVLLNFLPGVAAGLILGWTPVAAVFLGGVTYMSSSGVIAKLLDDLGWMGNRETPVVLSLLVTEDLLMAVYLPILAILTVSIGAAASVASILLSMTAVLVVLLMSRRYGAALSRLVFNPSDEAVLLTILGLTMVVAGIAERIQVSAAVGAFLVGIALSGPAADRAKVLLAPLRDLFAGVFFVFFGLEISPAGIVPVLFTAALLAAATAITKIATGWWAARRIGVGPRGRMRAGTILVARGEFSIAIAGIGVASGIDELGPLVAAYVLILAAAGSILARASDPLMVRVLRRRRPLVSARP